MKRPTLSGSVLLFIVLALPTGLIASCQTVPSTPTPPRPPSPPTATATPLPTDTPTTTPTATPPPTNTPTATPTATGTPACAGPFCRTAAAQEALLKAARKGESVTSLDATITALDTALREEIAAYLDAHLAPTRPLTEQTAVLDALRAALPNVGDDCTLLPADLDGGGRDELIVWNCANMPVGLLFTAGEKGYTAQSLPVADDADWIWPQLWFGPLDAQDVTGDGRPELLLSYILPGASMATEKFYVLAWDGCDFQTLFHAELVNWVGLSTWKLEPNPAGGQDIVLHYPHLYTTGFEAKMVPHPWATQRWRWNPSLGRYTLHGTTIDLESVLHEGEGIPEWELLRVLVNEAELRYQAGDLEEALAAYRDIVTRAADMERPQERAPHWPAYARFRIAQVLALLGRADAAQRELRALLDELDEKSNLRPLVQVFADAYDPAQPDAALRAMAALHELRLYEQFYWHDNRSGDLTFPMNMETLLWPGTPLACYLDTHPEAVPGPSSRNPFSVRKRVSPTASDNLCTHPPEREQALLRALSGLGFPVTDVRIADLNADGLNEVLVTTDETDQHNGPRRIWLLARTGDRWRSHRPPDTCCFCTEEVIEKPLPDGRTILRWREFTSTRPRQEFTLMWTGEALLQVDPETHEPLLPWPRVGCW